MRPLNSIVIDAIDQLDYIQEFHQLLEIAIDQPPEQMALLLKTYLQVVDPHLEEVGIRLYELQKAIAGEEAEVKIKVSPSNF